MDFSTITDPPKDGVKEYIKYHFIPSLDACFSALGLDVKRLLKEPKIQESCFTSTHLSPGLSGLRGIRGQGPYGNRFLAKIVELITLFENKSLRSMLDRFRLALNSLTGEKSKDPFRMTKISDLIKYLGESCLQTFKDLLLTPSEGKTCPSAIRTAIETGTGFRLAMFADGAGKTRYIAIGPWAVQAVLRPLHTLLFAWLRRCNNDATFHQEMIFDVAREWALRGNPGGAYS